MSRRTDLFIRHDDGPQLLASLGAAVHCPPVEVGDGCWEVPLGTAAAAELRQHDPSRPAAGFGWVLRARSDFDGPSHEDPVTIALRSVADDLRHGGCRVLLVHDLHHRRSGPATEGPGLEAHADPEGPTAAEAHTAAEVARPVSSTGR